MLTQLTAIALSAGSLLSLGWALVSYALARVAPAPRPVVGSRGLQRSAALAAHPSFGLVEPPMRWLAASIARVPLGGARACIAQWLVETGDALGLDADECLALSCLSAGAASVGGCYCAHALGAEPGWIVLWASLGAVLPLERARSFGAARKRRIARELPAAIDMIALCMGAGLDFSGALALLVARPSDKASPLAAELGRVLSELSIGRTRSDALSALALRAPIDAMRDFTSAVIQAELKGNPLQDAIAIQARMLRMRRSVAAEEAAARAAVLLAFPLLLLLASLMLLMLGPFFINGVEL